MSALNMWTLYEWAPQVVGGPGQPASVAGAAPRAEEVQSEASLVYPSAGAEDMARV
jgi:hypothetical protein